MQRGIFRGALDDQQRVVFTLILNGKTGSDIASILGVPQSQIDWVVRKTCRQLGVRGRYQAAEMIAKHLDHDRTATPTAAAGSPGVHAARANYRNGDESGILLTKTDQTEGERSSKKLHVADAGSQMFSKNVATGVIGKRQDLIDTYKTFETSTHTRRMLLIALLVVCSTLATSALISVMQGLEVLIGS